MTHALISTQWSCSTSPDNVTSARIIGILPATELLHVYTDSEDHILISPFSLEENDKELLTKQREWLTSLPRCDWLQSSWAASGRRGINPNFFRLEMEYRWRVELGNMVTDKLSKLWLAMAETFNRLLESKPGDPWQIIAPETGTGKTQGSCLYAALLGLYTDDAMLFVTRLTSQCDDAVRTVNECVASHCRRYRIRPREIAIAYHSKETKPSPDTIARRPFLAITHQMMTNIYDEDYRMDDQRSGRIEAQFDILTKWRDGLRIRVTDETPAGMVKDYNVVGHIMKRSLAPFMNIHLDQDEAATIRGLQAAWDWYEADMQEDLRRRKEAAKSKSEYDLIDEGGKLFVFSDYLGETPRTFSLSDHLEHVKTAPTPWRMSKARFRQDQNDAIDSLLAMQHMLTSWSVFLKDNRGCFITSAKLITPPDDMPMAVLDATAATSPYWKVFNKPKEVVEVPPSIRDYSSVTLHTCFQSGWTGKTGSEKGGKKRVEEILGHFEREHQETGRKRKVLFVLHKDAEKHMPHEVLETRANGDTVRKFLTPHFMEGLQVAHWGAIDGLNDYQSCDTVVIISLPYPPDHFGINLLFSNTNPEDRTDALLESSKEARSDLMFGETMVNIIQAINRVRCRKVTTNDGGCEETDVFMVLPQAHKPFTKDLLSCLDNEMSGLSTKRWSILVDGKEKTGVRKESFGHQLVRLLMDKAEGEYPLPELMALVDVSKSGQKNLKRDLGDPDSSLSLALGNLGCEYVAGKPGRGACARIVKH